MHRGKRETHLLTDDDASPGLSRPPATAVPQRLALDQIHPEADAPVVLVCAVDGDDVRVPDAREPAGLVEDAGREVASATSGFRSFSATGDPARCRGRG